MRPALDCRNDTDLANNPESKGTVFCHHTQILTIHPDCRGENLTCLFTAGECPTAPGYSRQPD